MNLKELVNNLIAIPLLILKKFLLLIGNYKNKNSISIFSDVSHKISFANKFITIKRGTVACPDLTIGSHTYVGYGCFLSANIGRYCSIANNVTIGPGEHPLHFPSTSAVFFEKSFDLKALKCHVSSDVWIGSGAIILRGVTLGTGSVIGANAVVTKDVEPYSIVVGSPARVIRFRFSPDKIAILLESKWWLLNPEQAFKFLKGFQNEHLNF